MTITLHPTYGRQTVIDLCRRSHGTNDDHVDLVVELAALIDKASEVNPDQELIDQLVENVSWNAEDAGFDLGFDIILIVH